MEGVGSLFVIKIHSIRGPLWYTSLNCKGLRGVEKHQSEESNVLQSARFRNRICDNTSNI